MLCLDFWLNRQVLVPLTSGASLAYTRFGRPDIGLIGMREVADTVTVIRERIDIELVVDGDTGYGNALNVMRTVKEFERAGFGHPTRRPRFTKTMWPSKWENTCIRIGNGRQTEGCSRYKS